ncbi:hypothetical protein M9H77_11795 [Catharanthus roseus]|uniref:Uncharacterized protein n=1 Tax=Catharanthus roseus TaxID=4058 RepID=A0ACC0BFI5_CATRO|nr:hypothetical protein M9H77_11795 [Catharanthus roseus]
MLHKRDKELPTIISHVQGVRIVLERDRLVSILGIPNNRNTITMDSNRRGNFPSLYPRALTYFFGHTLVRKGADLVKSENEDYQSGHNNYRKDKRRKEWIPSCKEDRVSSSRPCEDDDETKSSDDEEDEDGAQNTISMDAFQAKMRTAFE